MFNKKTPNCFSQVFEYSFNVKLDGKPKKAWKNNYR